MKTKLRLVVISYLILGLFIAACGQQDQGTPETTSSETGSEQQTAEQATTLPASEVLPTETAQVEVDLSIWGQGSTAVYSADGSLLAVSASYDGIYVYDSLSLQQISYIPEAYDILDIAFSADSKFISVAYLDSSQNAYGVQQFDLATNTEISNSVVLSRGDNYQPLTLGSLSPEGNTFALYDDVEGILTLWDVASREELRSLNIIYFKCLAFSPDGETLAIGDFKGTNTFEMTLWDVSSGAQTSSIDMLKLYNGPTGLGGEGGVGGSTIYSMRVAFSADGSVLAVAATYDYANTGSYPVTLIDLASGDELVSFDVSVVADFGGNPLFTMAFSNDGQLLASGSAAGIKIWDTESGDELLSIENAVENNSFAKYELMFSPDDAKLLSSFEWSNAGVIMWDVATGEKLAP